MTTTLLTTGNTTQFKIRLKAEHAGLTPDQFARLCSDNPELRFELTARKEILIMPPVFTDSGWKENELSFQLSVWSKKNRKGMAFGSSTGFTLANGAVRSPDASWLSRKKWDALTPEEKHSFAPVCPDFVIELRSASDSLEELQEKMEEYIACGASLGVLVDPFARQVWIYRPDQPPIQMQGPSIVSCDPELPGFVLELAEIWG